MSRRMKRLAGVLFTLMVLFSLTACGAEFHGIRIGNDNAFIMEYQMLNRTDSQELRVKAGDTIHASVAVEGGSLSLRIQEGEEDPIYEGDGISFSSEYDLVMKQTGIYTVTVTGKKAKGTVSFTVEHRK